MVDLNYLFCQEIPCNIERSGNIDFNENYIFTTCIFEKQKKTLNMYLN